MTAAMDSAIVALRDHCRVAMGLSESMVAEAGGISLNLDEQGAEFLAYRVTPETRPFQPAVRDTTVLLSVQLFYVRHPAEGEEPLSLVRQRMDVLVAAALDAGTWGAGLPNLVAGQTVMTALPTSGAGEYGQFFTASDPSWVGGDATVQLMLIL